MSMGLGKGAAEECREVGRGFENSTVDVEGGVGRWISVVRNLDGKDGRVEDAEM